MRILVNPNSVFIIIWVSLVALFSLGVLKINVPYSWGALFIVSVNVILALALFLITLIKRNVFDQAALRVFLGARRAVVDKYVRFLFFVYVLISVLDVIYSGGIPFIWKMVGDTKQYVDFGIPTLHGIANSIIYFLSALCVILYCLKVGSHRVILLTIFVWQFLIFSRGGVFQGTCRVNHPTMPLFSRPAAPDPGSASPSLLAPSYASDLTSVPGFSSELVRTGHAAEPGSDDPTHDGALTA